MTVSEDINTLIPQRDPIQMVDRLESVDGKKGFTSLSIKAGNFFIDDDGLIAEAGLIEHIAQSASALAGYMALQNGATEPPVGFIGEVSHFTCHYRPAAGTTLHTVVEMGPEAEGVTLLKGATTDDDGKVVADTRMKIFIENDNKNK